jgi:hypothetical protein
MSDYLWDKRGGDAEIERIEQALRAFAQATPPPPVEVHRQPPASSRVTRSLLLIAATLALVVGGAVFMLIERRATPAWRVTTASGRSTLPIGAWLDTGAGEATVAVADIGTVTVEPGARVRLLDSRAGHHRMELARGTMHATIWAPPNQFFVETPSTLAVDLGCAYTLTVDEDGGGLLTVLVGWVGFTTGDRESFIPAGFAAVTRPGVGPGTPYSERTSEAYRQALALLDFSPGAGTSQALTLVLDQSEERDEVTLWHLLTRVQGPDRDRVFDRLASFVPPPTGVTRDGIRAGDRRMLDAWWDALGLGTTSLWRTWSQQWKDNWTRR